MIANLLTRGLIAGLIAGLLAGLFAFAFGEPHIDRAIALEEAAAAAPSAGAAQPAAAQEPPPPVSRDGQRFALVVLAAPLFGLAVGGLFALGFAAVRGRTGARSDWSTAIGLAALLWLAVVLVPALKYPANPPAVGDPATIGSRTALYLVLVAISLLSLLAAWRLSRQLAERSPAMRQLAGAGLFVALVAVAFMVLPGVNEVPRGFPADLLWEFRLASLGTQVVLWSSLGVVFGLAAQRWPLPATRLPGPAPSAERSL